MKIAWLAGLIDGEGCFSISVAERNHHGQKLDFTARFSISMKSGMWVQEVERIFSDAEIMYHINTRKGQTCVAISGWRQVKKLAHLLAPYSVVKKPILEQFLTYQPATNNTFPSREQVLIRANLLDFVRAFNKGKNRRSKWTGSMILKLYNFA